jgi:hypothetical protein
MLNVPYVLRRLKRWLRMHVSRPSERPEMLLRSAARARESRDPGATGEGASDSWVPGRRFARAPRSLHSPGTHLAALGALVLVVAALGLPINGLFRYALVVISAVAIFTATISRRAWRWVIAAALVAACMLGQFLWSAPRIEEGHNVFLIDRGGGALEAGLPANAFRLMAAEFDAKYPPGRRCDPSTLGCWRGQAFPAGPFAFSADGIFQRPAYSRRVTGIDFADPIWLRLGFINEMGYDWNSRVSDVDRAVRDSRSFAILDRWRVEMPWFVMYRFPAAFAGSRLCWRGEVLWEGPNDDFAPLLHASMQCRTLTAEDIGRTIFGVAIKQEPPLAITLEPSGALRLRQLLEPGLALLGSAAVLVLLVRVRPRRLALALALIAITLAVVFFTDASFIGGVRPFDSGDDGLVFDGFARIMLRELVAGNFAGALEGGEKVFYFTPGMRYLRAVEHIVFGESYLGYLTLILLLPFLVFLLFRRFLPMSWALALVIVFAAIPVGVLFGSSLVQYVKWAARGFADPAAYTFFLGGLVLLLRGTDRVGVKENARATNSDRSLPPCGGVLGRGVAANVGREGTEEPLAEVCSRGFAAAWGAGMLFALALFVRPNIAPAAGILLGGAGAAALWQRHHWRAAGLVLGFLPMLGMALHNWIYGSVFALFTSTAAHPGTLVMPPSAYLAALQELFHFDLAGQHVIRGLRQIGGWLAGPSELLVMAPVNAAAILVIIRVLTWKEADPWLRLTALATLVQQGIGIFYAPAGRYYYLTWLLTFLVTAAWMQGEGLRILQQRFPAFAKYIACHPARLALARGLRRIQHGLTADAS